MDLNPTPDGLIRRSEQPDSDPELRRRQRSGRLERITRGVYRPKTTASESADEVSDARYRQLVVAIAGRSRERVVSHSSAASIHGLNMLAPDHDRVHFYVQSGGRRTRQLHLHERPSLSHADVTVVDGILLTKLALTACDVARLGTFSQAVVVLDHALRLGADRAELATIATRATKTTGVATLRRALAVADGDSESVGESVSRAFMLEWSEIPLPCLQTEYRDRHGSLIARVDFDWDGKVVGEFDGRVKYEKHRRPGESISDTVIREKRREDRLREEGVLVIRWVWDDFRNPQQLRARIRRALTTAGVI